MSGTNVKYRDAYKMLFTNLKEYTFANDLFWHFSRKQTNVLI